MRTSLQPVARPLPSGIPLSIALTCTLLLAACGKEQQGPGQMPPPPVGVVTVAPTSVPIEMELSGRLERSAPPRCAPA